MGVQIPTLESDIQYPSYFISEKNVADFILRKTKEHIEAGVQHPAFINSITGEEVAYADIEPKSRRVASALAKKGFRKGDVVIFSSYNVTQLPLFFLGVWRSGGIVRSSFPEDTNADLLERVLDSKCKWVLCDEEFGETYSSFFKSVASSIGWEVEVILFGDVEGCTSVNELFIDDGKAFPESVEIKLEDPLLILNTSGSTGKSKGAIYTHANLIPLFEVTELRKSSSTFLSLGCPTYVSGITMPIAQLLWGSQLIGMHKMTPKTLLEAVDKYKPDAIWGFPAHLVYLVDGDNVKNYDLSSVKVIMTGGVAVTPEQRKKFQTLPNLESIVIVYALSECPRIATTIDFRNNKDNIMKVIPGLAPNCVGRLQPNTSLRIYDEEGDKYNGPDEPGEILVKSHVNVKGYWNLPEETENLFLDGYLRTGDLGYYDKDGLLYFLDRKKQTFKYFGNHISPSEIEEILKSHPNVEDACVFGIPDTEHDGGAFPRAFVVLKDKQKSSEEVKQFAEKQLPGYKHIRGGLYITDKIPLGKTGKPSRLLMSQQQVPSQINGHPTLEGM